MRSKSVIPSNYDPHQAPEPVAPRLEITVTEGFVGRRGIFLRLSESRSTPYRKVYVLRFFGSKGRRLGPKYIITVKRSVTPESKRDFAPYSS